MEQFEGTVRLAGDTEALHAVMLVSDRHLKVATRLHEIGNWELDEITSALRPDGCHVRAEGEELIVSVADPKRFAEAIGPRVTRPGDGSFLGSTPEDSKRRPAARRTSVRLRTVPRSWIAAIGGVVLATALLVWAPIVIVAGLLLLGLAGVIVGGIATMDPFTAVRLPDPFTPTVLVRGGAALSIGALALSVVV
ncbi:MAG: hypothetical protein HKN74_04700 [Acidimicrobiia bacterium]|nr:hypothetical protein [Acidimicrobiia bacterium]MBT8217677.1 hypothetical protein [Acidimicrobiia bacterium]NNF09564.1 hypothetical protein [Acidimicrobiia bacterium]NNL71502.1 hypothetical protein [Acidimicrobiia bacterium]